ncbi:hypothetical protein F4777DRAFT_573938 [Nemania sp. FL0916]|nr:hypothetical protein F4777DRAFT_573938 [Nemania sp. FL0916]
MKSSPFQTRNGRHQLIAVIPRQNADIVATQGIYLSPAVDTPVWDDGYDVEFADKLAQKLKILTAEHIVRRLKYRQAADEWPMGYTPPEVKEGLYVETKVPAVAEGDTSHEDGARGEGHGALVNGKADAAEGRIASDRVLRSHVQKGGSLPTPALSARSPTPMPHGTKRHRANNTDAKGNEDKERPMKVRKTATRASQRQQEYRLRQSAQRP